MEKQAHYGRAEGLLCWRCCGRLDFVPAMNRGPSVRSQPWPGGAGLMEAPSAAKRAKDHMHNTPLFPYSEQVSPHSPCPFPAPGESTEQDLPTPPEPGHRGRLKARTEVLINRLAMLSLSLREQFEPEQGCTSWDKGASTQPHAPWSVLELPGAFLVFTESSGQQELISLILGLSKVP